MSVFHRWLAKLNLLSEGALAERLAEDKLKAQGLSLIQRSYRIRAGEIDLIMQDGSTLVFVEVRLRKNQSHGGALASINTAKQNKIIRTAQHYLQHHKRGSQHQHSSCRFDIVAFDGNIHHKQCQFRWIKAAFIHSIH